MANTSTAGFTDGFYGVVDTGGGTIDSFTFSPNTTLPAEFVIDNLTFLTGLIDMGPGDGVQTRHDWTPSSSGQFDSSSSWDTFLNPDFEDVVIFGSSSSTTSGPVDVEFAEDQDTLGAWVASGDYSFDFLNPNRIYDAGRLVVGSGTTEFFGGTGYSIPTTLPSTASLTVSSTAEPGLEGGTILTDEVRIGGPLFNGEPNPTSGELIIEGPGIEWINDSALSIGNDGNSGSMIVRGGASYRNLAVPTGFSITFGVGSQVTRGTAEPSAGATLLVTDPGTTFELENSFSINQAGHTATFTNQADAVFHNFVNIFAGTMTFSDSATALSNLPFQLRTSGSGAVPILEVTNQAHLTIANRLDASNGIVTVDNATITANQVDLGNRGQAAELVLQNGGEVVVTSAQFLVDDDGTLRGEGTVTGTLRNQGVIRPGFSPGIIVVNGDFVQDANGVLEIEVGGLTPGTQHDQLQVSGTATLSGLLEVPLIDGYVPALGDGITFLTAASVTGQFDAFVSPNLATVSPDVAIDVVYNAGSVDLDFVAVDDTNLFVSPDAASEWIAGTNWSFAAPDSTNATVVDNQIAADQTVNITSATGNVQVHELRLSGDAVDEQMTINVTDGGTLAATTAVTVESFGVLELGDDLGATGDVAASMLMIESDGAVTGSGALRTDVTVEGGATVSPGLDGDPIGEISVTGDYDQLAAGMLDIDVLSDETSDTLSIDGEAGLGGELMVDAADLTAADAGDTIEFLTSDGGVKAGTVFEEVMTENSTEVYVSPIYGETSVSLQVNLVGDMNGDGAIDPADVGAFALGLSNPLAFFLQYFVSPDSAGGNLDDNGRLDFDDIDEFAALIEGVSSAMVVDAVAAALEAPTVPEPGSAALLAVGLAGLMRLRASKYPRHYSTVSKGLR